MKLGNLMSNKTFTAVSVIAAGVLAFSGCAQSSTAEDVPPAPEQQPSEAITQESTPELPARTIEDFSGYLTDDQRNTATAEQIESYNACMAEMEIQFEQAGVEFDGLDAHYNCEAAIEPAQEYPDTSHVDWEHVWEVSDCYDELKAEQPELFEDLPPNDPVAVLEHTVVQEQCF